MVSKHFFSSSNIVDFGALSDSCSVSLYIVFLSILFSLLFLSSFFSLFRLLVTFFFFFFSFSFSYSFRGKIITDISFLFLPLSYFIYSFSFLPSFLPFFGTKLIH